MLSVPVSCSTDPTTSKPEVERRSVHRYASECFPLIRVLVRPSFHPYLANVQDVSVMGLGIICDRCLKPGAVLAVQLHASMQASPVYYRLKWFIPRRCLMVRGGVAAAFPVA